MEAIEMTKTYLDYSFSLFRYCFITICFVSLLGCSDSTMCWPLSCGGSTDSGVDSGDSDDDSEEETPSLSINNVSIKEGYTDSKAAVFTIDLNPAASKVVTVKYKTANDSAESGADYTATNGTITFPIGVKSKTVSISVLGDKIEEGEEIFDVILYDSNNAELNDDTGVVTITDAELCNSTNWCEGTYSTNNSAGSDWTSSNCLVNGMSENGSVTILFHHMANCGFQSIKASGDVGARWKNFATGYDSQDKEVLVKHLENNVFDLICFAGGSRSSC